MFDSLWLWWLFYRRGLAASQDMNAQVRLSALVMCGTPLITLVLTFLVYREPLFYTLYLPFFLVAILAGAGILRQVWKNSTSAWSNTITFRIGLISALLGFMVIVAGAYFSTLPATLGDVLLVIPTIVTLTPTGSEPSGFASMTELVREHYATYRNTGLLLTLVVLPVFTLVVGSLVMLMLRFVARRTSR
jgi:hypothetical protein